MAKIEARRWVNEVSGEALFDCYLTVRSREVSYDLGLTLTVCRFYLLLSLIIIFRTDDEPESQIFPYWKIYFCFKINNKSN